MIKSKPIKGYPNYSIFENGEVYSHKTKRFLKKHLNRGGYYIINLSRPGEKPKSARIHRLVAAAFLGAPPKDRQDINHIDGVKTNNNISNLEWSNKSLNGLHAFKNKLNNPSPQKGEKHGMSKLTEKDVLQIKRLSKIVTNTKIAELYDISLTHVGRILKNQAWKHLNG